MQRENERDKESERKCSKEKESRKKNITFNINQLQTKLNTRKNMSFAYLIFNSTQLSQFEKEK